MTRKEILRFSHVRTEERGGIGLKDFNLSVFAGELIYLTGLHGSGKHSVRGMLEGRQKQTGGRLYVDEVPVGAMDKRRFREKGIFVIDGSKSLSGNLSISENFFLLRPHRSGKFLYKEKYAASETRGILNEYGILCDPMAKVRSLNQCEQYLLSIAKAVSTGARLLVIDCLELSISLQEYGRLAGVLSMLKARGIAAILIDHVINPLLEETDRAVVVYDGRDLKVIDGNQLTIGEMAGYLAGAPLGEERQGAQRDGEIAAEKRAGRDGGEGQDRGADQNDGADQSREGQDRWITMAGAGLACVPEGKIVGLFDMSRDTRIPFERYMEEVIRENKLELKGRPFSSFFMACVPENGGDKLFYNMAPGDNLLLPSYRRIAGPLGRLPKGVTEYAASCFWEELGEEKASVAELNRLERKLLCICRWILAKAEVLFVENPDMGLDAEGQKRLFSILKEAAGQGILVCVTAHNPFILRTNCAVILQLDSGRVQEAVLPERFREQDFKRGENA